MWPPSMHVRYPEKVGPARRDFVRCCVLTGEAVYCCSEVIIERLSRDDGILTITETIGCKSLYILSRHLYWNQQRWVTHKRNWTPKCRSAMRAIVHSTLN